MTNIELLNSDDYAELYGQCVAINDGPELVQRLRHPKRGNLLAFQHGVLDAVLIVPGWDWLDRRGEPHSAEVIAFPANSSRTARGTNFETAKPLS